MQIKLCYVILPCMHVVQILLILYANHFAQLTSSSIVRAWLLDDTIPDM